MPKLAVLLTEGFADWEAAPLMAAARAYLGVGVATVTPGGQPVTSMGGLRVTPDLALEHFRQECVTVLHPEMRRNKKIEHSSDSGKSGNALEALTPDEFDGLAIIGGTIWETEAAPDIGPAVRAFRRVDRAIGGICAGTLAIARTGILRGITHTSNSLAFLAQSEHYHGHSSYLDVPFAVRDGHIVTASGLAPVSFAREMLAALGALTPEANDHLARFAEEHCPSAYRKAS